MKKLLKLKVWITIALLSCSTNLFANKYCNPSKGDIVSQVDSVLIAYDDLRVVNSKLIELEYEKEININLRQIVANDSLIIQNYNNINNKLNKDYKNAIIQRNVCFSVAVVGIISSILLLIK